MMGQCDPATSTNAAPHQLPQAVLQGAEASLLQYRRAVQHAETTRPRVQRARTRQVRQLAQPRG
jgi:hypothetical protein